MARPRSVLCAALATFVGRVSAFAPVSRVARVAELGRVGVVSRASPAEVAERLAEERMVLNFACFGFYERDCLLALDGDGSVSFSAGMISDGPGEWRVVGGDPDGGESPSDSYLEFSQPLTEVYGELYNVPGGVVFWRGKVVSAGDGLEVADGVAISEAQSQSSRLLSKVVLRGGGFQKEGTFTARLVLPSDDEDALPQPVSIELFDDDTDDAAAAAAASKSRRKRKKLPKSDKGFTAEKA